MYVWWSVNWNFAIWREWNSNIVSEWHVWVNNQNFNLKAWLSNTTYFWWKSDVLKFANWNSNTAFIEWSAKYKNFSVTLWVWKDLNEREKVKRWKNSWTWFWLSLNKKF